MAEHNKKQKNRKQYAPRVRISPEEFDILKQYRAIKEESDKIGVDDRDVKHGWLKSKNASLFFKNPNFADGKLDIDKINFKELLKDAPRFAVEKSTQSSVLNRDAAFDRLVFTDVHIGMDPTNKGRGLYDIKWNEEVLTERLEQMVKFTIQNQKSNILYITDLGDFLDGLNGLTTRGGHSLPQNMSNQECFDAGFKFKSSLIFSLLPYYDKIIFRNICNDNHSADFAYFVNSALKFYFEKNHKNVEIINQTKFLDYTIIDNKYCFVTMHGKDAYHMKHGFKVKLDPGQTNRLLGYLNENRLTHKDYEIIIEKGDSHQYLFDSATSDQFKYYNYPAFSPSSDWVVANFQLGRSGFIHFNFYADRKSINEFFF
jgi:hypothetical protein